MISESNLDRSAEDIARRYSMRPGHQLVGYREVGLPFYYLRMRAVVMAQKPVPAISEYVLRILDLGLKQEDDLAGLLGLERPAVMRALVDLRRSEEIDLVAPPGKRMQEWSITNKGQTTLQAATRVVPEEVSLPAYYDGLLRKVVVREQASLMLPRDAREAGIFQIPPVPARRPEVDEITIGEVNEAIRATIRRKRSAKRDLLVLKAVLRADLLFERAVMLIYQSLTGSDFQVGFVVDGMLSSAHEQAFIAGDGLKKLGIAQQLGRRGANDVLTDLVPDLAKQLGDLSGIEALQQQARNAEAKVEADTERLNSAATPEERRALDEKVESSRRTARSLQEKLDSLPVVLVETYEHRGILERAIRDSKARLMINSPWINASAVTHFFLRELERRLKDGLWVYIAYGLDKEAKWQGDRDRDALNALRTLQRSYPRNFRLSHLGDTHAKILISDSSFMVVTSFNWLSFRGDPRRTFRDERGVLVRLPAVVDAQFDQILKRMDEADARERGQPHSKT